jgi:hypothetical protein
MASIVATAGMLQQHARARAVRVSTFSHARTASAQQTLMHGKRGPCWVTSTIAGLYRYAAAPSSIATWVARVGLSSLPPQGGPIVHRYRDAKGRTRGHRLSPIVHRTNRAHAGSPSSIAYLLWRVGDRDGHDTVYLPKVRVL